MKSVYQLLLISLLILISIFFYKYYFKTYEQVNEVKNEIINENLEENQNNLIKNLSYKARFDDNKQYIITAETSELIYENDIEIVKMQKVTAKFIDEKNSPLVIISEYAKYNNSNYNTEFSGNILIKYKDNTIKSDNLDLDFVKNIATVYNNVEFDGSVVLPKLTTLK